MDTWNYIASKAADAAGPQEVPGDMCFSNTGNIPYPRRNYFSPYWHVQPIVNKKQ